MSRIPDFASIGWDMLPNSGAAEGRPHESAWITPEDIPVKRAYDTTDMAGIDFLRAIRDGRWDGPPYPS